LGVVVAERDKRVGFRVVGGDRSGRDVVRYRGEAVETQRNAGRKGCFDINHITVFKLADGKIRFVVGWTIGIEESSGGGMC
jgi:hypothetical protein